MFNGIRFLLGGAVLLPLLFAGRRRSPAPSISEDRWPGRHPFAGCLLAGAVLFLGASLQQVGIVDSSAGKAGFITGLYVVIVPMLGFAVGQRPGVLTGIGAGMAVGGLYFLSIRGGFTLARGDGLVLCSAFFWAVHVQLIGWLVRSIPPIRIASLQFLTCGLLSFVVGWVTETTELSNVADAAGPILFAGLCSTAVAYTLQVVAQKRARPTHAAILLSLEAVFAALGGWLLLNEMLTPRNLAGCGLMLGGMVLSQLDPKASSKPSSKSGP
jgi:drug/metabolite transporter (DMT)-like permease